jgi:predicted DNA-binding protein
MPATSPRFSITVPHETHAALKRLSAVQKRPLGSLVREYLESVTPALDELAGAMEAMREVEAAARSEIVSTLSEVHQEMEPHINGIIGHLRALSGIEVDDAQDEGGAQAVGLRDSLSTASTPAM